MTTTDARSSRTARVITEVLSPYVVITVLAFLAVWHATHHTTQTLLYGGIIAAGNSLIPLIIIAWGARAKQWEGHHVRNRRGRLIPFITLLTLSTVAMITLRFLTAPPVLIQLNAAMLALLAVTGLITIRWKISVHTATATAAITTLALIATPWWLLAAPVVPAIAWSRVRLHDHTTAQVVAGTLAGAITTLIIMV